MNETHDRSIISSIRKMSGSYNADTLYIALATVLSVDEDAGICDVEPVTGQASTVINNVRLQTQVGDGMLLIPAVGSQVKVLYSTRTDPFIVQYSDVQNYYIAAIDKMQFNDGAFGGWVKVIELTEKLNNLENKLNNLLTSYNSHVHNVTALGAPTGPGSAPVTGTLTPTQRTDIENKNISHGE